MNLPSSKVFIVLLIFSFIAMIVFSAIGTAYEKEVLARIGPDEAAKLSITIFIFLGSIFSISSIALFIRHFSRRAIKVVAINKPEYAEKLKQRLNPQFLNKITLIIFVFIILGSLYTVYEVLTGKF